jgi:hypothetical protein
MLIFELQKCAVPLGDKKCIIKIEQPTDAMFCLQVRTPTNPSSDKMLKTRTQL